MPERDDTGEPERGSRGGKRPPVPQGSGPRRWLRVAMAPALVALGLALALLALRPVGGAWLAELAVEAARGRGVDLELEALYVIPLSAEFRFRGLSLTGGPAPLESLAIAEGSVTLSRRRLLIGQARPKEVHLVAPEVVLRRSADESEGRGEGPAGVDAAPFSALRIVTVDRGRVSYLDEVVEFSGRVEGLGLGGVARRGGGSQGYVRSGALHLEIEGAPPIDADSIRGRWTWRAPRLELTEMALEGGQVDALGTAVLELERQGISLEARAEGSVGLEWVASEWELAEMSGRAGFDARFQMRNSGPWELSSRVFEAGPIDVAGVGLKRVQAQLRVSPEGVFVSRGEVDTERGTALRELELGWRSGSFTAAGRGDASMAELLAIAELPEGLARGRAEFEVEAAGQAGQAVAWSLEGLVAPPRDDRSGAVSGLVSASGDGEGGEARFSGTWGGANLRAAATWDSGEAGATPWNADLEIAAGDAAAVSSLLRRGMLVAEARDIAIPPELRGLEGRWLAGSATLSGLGQELRTIEIGGALEELTVSGLGPATLEARAARSDRGAWRLQARLGDAGTGQGVLASLQPGHPQRLLVDAHDAPLAWLALASRLAGLELPCDPEGSLAGRAEIELSEPLSLEFAAAGRGRCLGAPETVFSVRGGWREGVLHLARAEAHAFFGSARVWGRVEPASWGRDQPGEGLRLAGSASLDLDRAFGFIDTPARGRASWTGELVLDGEDAPLRALGRLSLEDFGTADLRVPTVDLALDLDEGGVAIRGGAGGIHVETLVSGSLEAPSFAGQARWEGLELTSLMLDWGLIEELPALAARTSGSLRLSGSVLDPETWRGDAEVERLAVDAGFASLDLVRPVTVRIDEGRATIDGETPARLDAYTGDHLEVRGSVGLWSSEPGSLDLELLGAVDLRFLEAFDPDIVAGGKAQIDLRIAGELAQPSVRGRVTLQEGRARLLPMRESISALAATIELEGTRATVESGSFSLGGGRARFSGFFILDGWIPGALDLTLVARDVALSAPEGFWGRYDADLLVRGTLVRPELAGKVRIRTARYDDDFELTPRLFARARSLAPQASRASWLAGVGLDLELVAPPVVSIRNEQARAEISMNFAVGGTATRPLIAGSADFVEGGRFEFRGVSYQIIAGQLTLDELRGRPARLRLRARTDLQGYSIRLELDATTEGVDYKLTSTPALTEGDILALLLTGETLSASAGNLRVDPGELAAAYFGSSIGELILADTARLLGFTEFRIGTARVGPQAEPVARVTLGRRLDERTLALYSRDLSNEGRDVYRIERDLGRNFRAEIGREALGGVGGGFRWFHRLGDRRAAGEGPSDEEASPRYADVRLEGLPDGLRVRRISDLGIRRRDELNRSRILQAREGLLLALISAGYLEAGVVDARVEPAERAGRGVLVLSVEAGERWTLEYDGPRGFEKSLRSSLAEIWAATRFSLETVSDAERILDDELANDGYAAALVDLSRPDPQRRMLRLSVDPGPRVVVAELNIEGVSALEADRVRQQVLSRPGGGLSRSVYKPRTLAADVNAIRTLYESKGYLASSVETRVRYRDEGSRVALTLMVEEGPLYRFGKISIEGDWPADLPAAAGLLTVSQGQRFDPEAIVASETVLRRELDAKGYYAARVLARAELGEDESVAVTFRLQPGEQAIIGDIAVEGLEHTERRLVDRAIAAKMNEPLTSAEVRNTERDLFRLGLFRRVSVDLEPIEEGSARKRLVLRVEETPRWSLLLSAGYDTEEKLRGSASLSNENLFGRGRVGSLQVFASSITRGVRLTLEDRHLRRGKIEALATLGSTREEKVGFTLDQVRGALQFGSPTASRRRWLLRYQVDANNVRDVTLDEQTLQDELDNEGIPSNTELLAGIVASFILDERDDPFLPENGWLARTELGFWDEGLGSDANFSTWTGQVSLYRPLVSRLAFAGSMRLGAGWTLRNTASIPISERFFAGGAQSLRGFERDQAGPFDPVSGEFLGGGGEALLVTNLELRYRIRPSFDLVLFQDNGNVWARLDDVDLADLRETIGLGVRWRSPVGLLRLEYGRKLDAREGESSGEIFLSIGEPW